MKLHHSVEDFEILCGITSQEFNIPIEAIRKDYYITYILEKLSRSEFVNCVIFKGGTSLSKCYPNSIERFSEDIDLTLIPKESESNNSIENRLKEIEAKLTENCEIDKIIEERTNRNKSCWVWFDNKVNESDRIKLEIGSSVKPDPYSKRKLRSYIHEYLLGNNDEKAIEEFQLKDIELNVLNIERTFVDKLMAIKRHALCGTLNNKVRHIYDIVKLYEMDEIQSFLKDKEEFGKIIAITKESDCEYLEKRPISIEYNSKEKYNFKEWKYLLDSEIKKKYESLHKDLLYTNKPQNWEEVEIVFLKIDKILNEVEE